MEEAMASKTQPHNALRHHSDPVWHAYRRSAHAFVALAADYLVTPEFDGPIKWGC